MEYRIAELKDSRAVESFFDKNLDRNNPAIYSEEFYCPKGLWAALKKRWVVIAIDDGVIVGAARFYPRKRDQITSLYQFAVDVRYRGGGVVCAMLEGVGCGEVESACKKDVSLNEYYHKTGWVMRRADEEYNYWYINGDK